MPVTPIAFCAGLTALLCGGGSPASPVVAVRVARAPALDAREGGVWSSVDPNSDFTQWSPHEDGAPSFRTEFRVLYDSRNLYVLVRAFDPHPDSIVRTVTRRDGTSASDEIGIYIDGNEDHRTGYEFYVNAAGVQRDVALSEDTREDVTWDAVWQAVTRIDSLGWTAEFRIPFSQIRFPAGTHQSFGFLVNRVIQRKAERVSWPAYHPSRTGIVSQFGVLAGLDAIGDSPGIDVAPFASVRSRGTRAVATGVDAHIRLASNVGVDATVLPDFGQVEADPSVVNLSSVETFYPEHRPFFLDGAGTFRVGFNCMQYYCANDGLFYSRRIGRTPQLASLYGSGARIDPVPILAAAKLTSRAADGMGIGAIAATTGRVSSSDGRTLEPATTYGMLRAQRESPDGAGGASAVLTLVDRALDQWTNAYLSATALVGGTTFRHRFGGGQYEVWGSATASRLGGSARAITSTQENPVHLFQRTDDNHLDTTRTSLSGDQEELVVGKYGGAFNFEIAYERQSRGYDSNDLGFLDRADEQISQNWIGYTQRRPTSLYKMWWANLNQWTIWNAAGARIDTELNTNAHIILENNWQLNSGITMGQIGHPVCDHCARGGPALRTDAQLSQYIDVVGDPRGRIVPELYIPTTLGGPGRVRSVSFNPSVAFRVSPQFQASVGVVDRWNVDGTQWFGNFTDASATRYAFARLHQRTRSMTIRTSYAATPLLSLETYVAPFASDGVYSDLRAMSDTPRAAAYNDRFVSFTPPAGTAEDFRVHQLQATSVLRWEYAPGSTLFFVWGHDRANTFTLKVSYWLGLRR